MFKKLMLLSAIASLGACSSFSQCDSDKNYVVSNPQVIDEFKKLKSEKKIRSIYYKTNQLRNCYWDHCVNFDSTKFDFIERDFNDQYRKGTYRIYATKDTTRTDCMEHNELYQNLKDICFYTVKNEIGIIYSDYIYEDIEKDGISKSNLYNKKNKKILFDVSSQIYSTHALIGTSSAGYCKSRKNNNPDYKFNISDLVN